MAASFCNNLEMINALVKVGGENIDVNYKSPYVGAKALSVALYQGTKDTVTALLAMGSMPNHINDHGR